MHQLRVGGLTPLTTIDYPGELAAVVFCQGCPWRCSYCQNSELLAASAAASMSWDEVLAFLARRQGLLDAVVFSGGEPTLQRGLEAAIAEVRKLGFKIGLHTAGCYPDRLEALLPSIDWVGLDIKTLPEHYAELTAAGGSGAAAWTSLRHVLASQVSYEVRVTVHPCVIPEDRLNDLLVQLAEAGVDQLALQRSRPATLQAKSSPGAIPTIGQDYSALFEHVAVR